MTDFISEEEFFIWLKHKRKKIKHRITGDELGYFQGEVYNFSKRKQDVIYFNTFAEYEKIENEKD